MKRARKGKMPDTAIKTAAGVPISKEERKEAHKWVTGMNAYPLGMVELLMAARPEDWRCVAAPKKKRARRRPTYGCLWAFKGASDLLWLETEGGITAMAKCGFYVYENQEWGYFFGVDGDGRGLFEKHWLPAWRKRNPKSGK